MFSKLLSKLFGRPPSPSAPHSHHQARGAGDVAASSAEHSPTPPEPTPPPRRPARGIAVAPIATTLRPALAPYGIDLLDEKIRRSLEAIPPLPQLAIRILQEMSNPKSSAKSIAELAAQDTSLATAILRTANSAAHATSRSITSIQEAVALVGFSSVRALLVRLKLAAVLGSGPASPELEELWTHGLAVAQIAEVIAPRFGADRGVCSTLGLLHDLGKLVILRTRPDAVEKLKTTGSAEESYLGRERRVLGADHADIGAHIATQWKLPAELAEGIRFHHSPHFMPESLGVENRLNVAVVHLANQLSKFLHLYSDDTEIDIIHPEVWAILGFEGQGDLETLIDGSVRRAVTEALIMAEAALGVPPSATGRVIRISSHVEGQAMLAEAAASTVESRIRQIPESASDVFFGAVSADARIFRIEKTVTSDNVAQEIDDLLAAFEGAEELRRRLKLTLRWLVSSVRKLDPGTAVDVAITREDGQIAAYVRCDALRFDRRFGTDITPQVAARILDRECSGVINLGWFDELSCSKDGGALRLAA